MKSRILMCITGLHNNIGITSSSNWERWVDHRVMAILVMERPTSTTEGQQPVLPIPALQTRFTQSSIHG
jgi:hypothetical protein